MPGSRQDNSSPGARYWRELQEWQANLAYGGQQPMPSPGDFAENGQAKFALTDPVGQANSLSLQYENQLRAAQFAEEQQLARLAREQSAATLQGHQQRMQQGYGDIAGAGALAGGSMGLRSAQMGAGQLRAQGGIDLMQLQAIDEQERLRRRADAMRRRGEYGLSALDVGSGLYSAGVHERGSDFAYRQAADAAEEEETIGALGDYATAGASILTSGST
jgi:hypothetical protein